MCEYFSDRFAYFRKMHWLIAGLDGALVGNVHGAVVVACRISTEGQELESSNMMS